MDLVVTVPASFRYSGSPHRGLLAWAAEGDLPGTEPEGIEWHFSTSGPIPRIEAGDRVYVVCEGRLRGYAPLLRLEVCQRQGQWARLDLVRGAGAVAVTIEERIIGFRGWRYRWWVREHERTFPDWLADAACKCQVCRAGRLASGALPLFKAVEREHGQETAHA